MMKLETEKEREVARKDFIRDVKKHLDDISKKYILPDEGTMDYALMYVPSEPVFYEIANDSTLAGYAQSRRVYVVSPTTLYMILQTILLSNEGKKIESKSKQVFQMLKGAQQEYGRVESQLGVLESTFNQCVHKYVDSEYNILTVGEKAGDIGVAWGTGSETIAGGRGSINFQTSN